MRNGASDSRTPHKEIAKAEAKGQECTLQSQLQPANTSILKKIETHASIIYFKECVCYNSSNMNYTPQPMDSDKVIGCGFCIAFGVAADVISVYMQPVRIVLY